MQVYNECDYLVHLVKSFVCDETPKEIPEGFSFEKVFKFGKLHEVANIAYLSVLKLNNKPSDELLKKWKECYYLSAQRDGRQLLARQELINAFCNKGIRSLEVQGTVIKPLYPSTDLRMMSDLDFIVDTDNIKKAEDCLLELGYETSYPEETEVHGKKKDINIEVHSQFFADNEELGIIEYYAAMNSPFGISSPTDDNSLIYKVNHTYLYLYSLLHLLKHYEFSGCGIRRFVDFYYLRKAYDDIDYDYISSVISNAGKDKPTNELMQLFEYWFYDKEPSIDLTPVRAKVYSAGNHGTENLFFNNRIAYGKSQHKHYSKYNFIIEFFFPKKEHLYLAYPFCKEHNYPIVLCWLHRAFFSIFSARKLKGAIHKIKKYLSIKTK